MMKRYYFLICLLLSGFIACKSDKNSGSTAVSDAASSSQIADSLAQKYTVDTSKSLLYWKGSSIKGSHNGSLGIAQGWIKLYEGKLISGEIEIDMHTLKNIDLVSGDGKEDLEEHLKSLDFFNVDSFSRAKYVLNAAESRADSVNNVLLKGVLTIKGISHPVDIPAQMSISGEAVMISVSPFVIDRTKWNVMYSSKTLLSTIKDKIIDDEVYISSKLMAIKNSN